MLIQQGTSIEFVRILNLYNHFYLLEISIPNRNRTHDFRTPGGRTITEIICDRRPAYRARISTVEIIVIVVNDSTTSLIISFPLRGERRNKKILSSQHEIATLPLRKAAVKVP